MTNSTQTHVRAVSICLRYTDGGNWKQSESYILDNPDNIPFEDIDAAFNEIDSENVVPLQWGLPSLSTVDHEDMEVGENSEQHCYHMLQDLHPLYEAEYTLACKEMPKADNTLTTILAAIKRGQSEEYEARGTALKASKIAEAKKVLKDNGHHVFTQLEFDCMIERMLPVGLDRELLLTVASVGLSNSNLITFLMDRMDMKESALRELQTMTALFRGD
jgi:hypothetical protein